MSPRTLWFGPVATLLFFGGTVAIGLATPGYSLIRQTVSELGEVGAPGQLAFTLLLCVIAAALLASAFGIAKALRSRGSSIAPAILVGTMAVSCAGVGLFAFPLPLHNVFGLSETIGFQAPLAAAMLRSTHGSVQTAKRFSAMLYALVVLAIAVNLMSLFRPPEIWELMRPVFGIVQRSLFATWFFWCAGYCWLLGRTVPSR